MALGSSFIVRLFILFSTDEVSMGGKIGLM